jgi:hypothetical protein
VTNADYLEISSIVLPRLEFVLQEIRLFSLFRSLHNYHYGSSKDLCFPLVHPSEYGVPPQQVYVYTSCEL